MAQRRPTRPANACINGAACLCAFLAAIARAGAQEPGSPETFPESEPPVARAPVGPVETVAEEISAEERAEHVEFVARLEAQLKLRDLLDEEEYSDAIPVAERIVELSREEHGEDASETAVAISNLAEVQRRAGLYEASGENFLQSVEIFRQAEGEFSESMIVPLVGLGASYHAMGEYPQAATVFQEARTVNRRVFGLLNEDQILILDHLANTMLSMEQYEEADEQKLEALRIMERTHGADSVDVLPALYKHALWLRATYRFHEEREFYGRALRIIRDMEGNDSPLLARPLREIGNSFRIQKLPEGRGISSLNRALELLESQPEPDKRELAEVLRDLGDWQVAFSKVGPTGEEYRRAWQLLTAVEGGERLQRRWFDEPDYVLRENPSTRGLVEADTPGAQPGHVLVTFDVTPEGRTVNVSVVESEPPGLKDLAASRSIERSRFRPRMVDGELVYAPGRARDFTFFYRPPEEEAED